MGVPQGELSHFHVYNSGRLSEKLSFSFSSSQWLVFYELGVAECLQDKLRRSVLDKCEFLGSSTGSLAATALALNLDINGLTRALMELSCQTCSRLLGPLSGLSGPLKEVLNSFIWPDVDNGYSRLFIQVSSFPFLQTHLATRFTDKQVVFINDRM